MISQERQQCFIKVIFPMIETVFALLQVEEELFLAKTVELLHSSFGEAPETLDPIDVSPPSGELVVFMVDPEMLLEPDIDQAVVPAPKVRMDNGVETDFAPYNGLQGAFLAVRDDLCIDPSVPFEDAEDDCFATGTATPFPADPAAAEIRLVNFYLSALKGGMPLAFLHQTEAYFLKDQIDAFPSNTRQLACFAGRQIHGKISQNLAKFPLGNSGTAIIPV
jgi:hypothetical protein